MGPFIFFVCRAFYAFSGESLLGLNFGLKSPWGKGWNPHGVNKESKMRKKSVQIIRKAFLLVKKKMWKGADSLRHPSFVCGGYWTHNLMVYQSICSFNWATQGRPFPFNMNIKLPYKIPEVLPLDDPHIIFFVARGAGIEPAFPVSRAWYHDSRKFCHEFVGAISWIYARKYRGSC